MKDWHFEAYGGIPDADPLGAIRTEIGPETRANLICPAIRKSHAERILALRDSHAEMKKSLKETALALDATRMIMDKPARDLAKDLVTNAKAVLAHAERIIQETE